MVSTSRARSRRLWARAAAAVVRVRSDLVIAALDVVLVAAAYTAAQLLRFDGSVPDHHWDGFQRFLPIAVALTLVVNAVVGLYGQLWRHASIVEARQLAAAGSITTALLVLVELLGERRVPYSVVILGGLVATALMAALRFQSRLFSFRRGAGADGGLRVVVIGSGDAAAGLVADMLRSPRAGFLPVAAVDEDPRRHGRTYHGLTVEGGIEDLPEVVRRHRAHLAVFAVTSAPQSTVRHAAEVAEIAGVALKVIPGISSSMRAGNSVKDLRDLRIEDLLGRDQVVTDLEAVTAMLAGRRVLITGAGGSIGSEIARQVAACRPAALVLLDHDETHLHDVAAGLDGPITQLLADIRDASLVAKVFDDHRPEVVFHAAAHKHVPLLEAHPCEAVATNVVGTRNVLDAAALVGVGRLVFISTDKAVYPSSVMGASKRLGEHLVVHRTPPGARYCAVRFGNVLGSRGSVVPTFMRQIEAGGPVTVTDPRMTRFFMSIEEAVQLVLQAAALADESRGEVFMLDMGEPVRILELAERMIRLTGRTPGTDIEIRVTGIRPGEKLAEELVTAAESRSPTVHPSIERVAIVPLVDDDLELGVDQLEALAGAHADEACAALLRHLASDGAAAAASVVTSRPEVGQHGTVRSEVVDDGATTGGRAERSRSGDR